MKILKAGVVVIASVFGSLSANAEEQVVSITTSSANDVPEIIVTYKRESENTELDSAYATAEAADLMKGEVLADLSVRLAPQDS